MRFFLNETAFSTCHFVKLFTWWDCDLYVSMYRCMYIWNHTSQLHIMGMQHIHAGCRIQKSEAVARCEQCHGHPDNLLHAIKTQSHSQTSLHSSRMPTARALVDRNLPACFVLGGGVPARGGGGLLVGRCLLLGGCSLRVCSWGSAPWGEGGACSWGGLLAGWYPSIH